MGDGKEGGTLVTTEMGGGTRRTISPYDLSPSDNPGCVISQPLLRSSNYDEWSSNIRLALMSRKKFGFVDGTIPKPTTDSKDHEDWRCNNALVVSWIKLTIEPSLRTMLSRFEVGKELWDQIQKRFAVKDGAKIGKIKAEIANARQNGRPMETYFGAMTQLWAALEDYRQPKACRCGSCTCDIGAEIARERDEDRVYDLLRGLDETYGNLRSSLISRVPFPSLDDVYLTLTQDEDSRESSVHNEGQSDGVSFAVQTLNRSRNTSVEKNRGVMGKCKSCGRSGHTAEQCFRTIGYPPWWGSRPRYGDAGGGEQEMVTVRNRGTSSANAVGTFSQGGGHAAHVAIGGGDRVGLSGLTDVQWKGLVQLLAEHSVDGKARLTGNYFSESWIYDSGASNHMTGSK